MSCLLSSPRTSDCAAVTPNMEQAFSKMTGLGFSAPTSAEITTQSNRSTRPRSSRIERSRVSKLETTASLIPGASISTSVCPDLGQKHALTTLLMMPDDQNVLTHFSPAQCCLPDLLVEYYNRTEWLDLLVMGSKGIDRPKRKTYSSYDGLDRLEILPESLRWRRASTAPSVTVHALALEK